LIGRDPARSYRTARPPSRLRRKRSLTDA
jgi:hypothetical protein